MMRPRIPALRTLLTTLLLLALALGLPACKRDPDGQLPVAGGEAIKAQREAIKGFAVARAWPDQRPDGLAVAVEFSRPLVGTQDFDKLLVIDAKGNDQGGWALSDDGKTLRFPHVEANRHYALKISGALTAADGSTLGKDIELKVFTGELDPAVGFA